MHIDHTSRHLIPAADTVTVGAFLTLCREYGHDAAQFARKYPEQWRPVMDAGLVRHYLAGSTK